VKKKFGGDKPASVPKGAAGQGGPGGQAGPGGQGGPGGADKGKGKRGGMAGFSFNMKSLDKNSDNKVTQDELPEMMQSRLCDMDKNADGHQDDGEVAEVNKAIQQRIKEMQQNGGAPG